MSGAEVAFALGTASQIISVIKGCYEATCLIVEFCKDASKVPQEISDLDAVLTFIEIPLGEVKARLSRGEARIKNPKALEKFLNACLRQVETIKASLKSVLPKLKTSFPALAWRAIKSVVHEESLHKAMNELRNNTMLLLVQQTEWIVSSGPDQRNSSHLHYHQHQQRPLSHGPQKFYNTKQRFNSSTSTSKATTSPSICIPTSDQIAIRTRQRTGRRVDSSILNWMDEVASMSASQQTNSEWATSTGSVPKPPADSFEPALSAIDEHDEQETPEVAATQPADGRYADEESIITVAASPNDLDAIQRANFLLSHGCSQMPGNMSQARKVLRSARCRAASVRDNHGPVGVRKYRLLTHISIALSVCTKGGEEYLDKARSCNRTAMGIASRAGSAPDKAKCALDVGYIQTQLARREPRGSTRHDALQQLAFETYEGVADMATAGELLTVDDHLTYAGALLGCGRLADKLYAGGSLTKMAETSAEYLARAESAVHHAKRIPYSDAHSFRALKAVEAEILDEMARLHHG